MFALDDFTMEATNLSKERYFVSTNYMMSDKYTNQYFDYRVTGGKPAAASSADRSMICTAQVGNSHYLFVVMSAQAKVSEDGMSVTSFENFLETKKLMNFAFNNYTVRQVDGKDQSLYQYAVKNGMNDVVLRAERDVFVLLPADFDKNAVIYHNVVDASGLQAPIAASDKLGVLQISYQGLILTNCDLVAMNAVSRQGALTIIDERIPVQKVETEELWDQILTWGGIAAVAIAVLALVVFLLVKGIQSLGIRRMQMVRARKRKSKWGR
jgi:D-alanyl-D-alanine carboxypeptidase